MALGDRHVLNCVLSPSRYELAESPHPPPDPPYPSSGVESSECHLDPEPKEKRFLERLERKAKQELTTGAI